MTIVLRYYRLEGFSDDQKRNLEEALAENFQAISVGPRTTIYTQSPKQTVVTHLEDANFLQVQDESTGVDAVCRSLGLAEEHVYAELAIR